MKKPLRILVADDEPTVRLAVRLTLEERGHEVLEAGDVREALALVRSSSFDALIVDVRMPGGGLTLLDQLRELAIPVGSSHGPAARTILLTADLNRPETVRAIEEGQPYLPKPFHFDELVEVVEKVAREASAERRGAG